MEEVYPCTPLQEGMMAENLLDPSANVEQLRGVRLFLKKPIILPDLRSNPMRFCIAPTR